MNTSAVKRREIVTPMALYSYKSDDNVGSRSGAFAALARLAANDNRLSESVELYRLAIEEDEERFGPDSNPVRALLREIAEVYASLGQLSLCVFYRRRANSK